MSRFQEILSSISEQINEKNLESLASNPSTTDNTQDIKIEAEESSELMEYKQDFYDMSVGSIRAIMHHAQQIINNLDNPMVQENLTESWLQGKIAITEDYMRTIHDYVMFVSDTPDESNTVSKQGLWDNIRQKKEKEGKKYKPAKRGDKDRPEPKQWKKLSSRFISDPVVWDEKTDEFVNRTP